MTTLSGYPVHIDTRTNPEYQYDDVLAIINYNFEYVGTALSGATSALTGVFISGVNTYVTTGLTSIAYNVSGLSIDSLFVSGTTNTVLTGDTINGGLF